MATRGTGGSTTPPPTCRRSCCWSRLLAKPRVTSSASTRLGGGWPKPPSGRRPISPERAGPERAPRGGVSMAPTEGLSEGGEQRGAPPRDALLGRTRRRVGGRRSMRRPSDSAVARWAKEKASRSERKNTARGRARPERRFTRGTKDAPPRNQEKPGRFRPWCAAPRARAGPARARVPRRRPPGARSPARSAPRCRCTPRSGSGRRFPPGSTAGGS